MPLSNSDNAMKTHMNEPGHNILQAYHISRYVVVTLSGLFGIMAVLSLLSLILILIGVIPATQGGEALPVSQQTIQVLTLLALILFSFPGIAAFWKRSSRIMFVQGAVFTLLIPALPFIVVLPTVLYTILMMLGGFGLWLVMFLSNKSVKLVLEQENRDSE